jgi:hypothetical protein
MLRDIPVGDGRAGPDPQSDRFPQHKAAVCLDEHQEDLKDPFRHRYDLRLPKEKPAHRVKAQLTKKICPYFTCRRLRIGDSQEHSATVSCKFIKVINKSKTTGFRLRFTSIRACLRIEKDFILFYNSAECEFAGGLRRHAENTMTQVSHHIALQKEENSSEIRNAGGRDLHRWRIPC